MYHKIYIYDHHNYDKDLELLHTIKSSGFGFTDFKIDSGWYIIVDNKRYVVDTIEHNLDDNELYVYCEQSYKRGVAIER